MIDSPIDPVEAVESLAMPVAGPEVVGEV